MAKDGDIVDFMLGGIFKLIGKIIGTLATWAGKLIVLIFSGIWKLLKWLFSTIVELLTTKKGADEPSQNSTTTPEVVAETQQALTDNKFLANVAEKCTYDQIVCFYNTVAENFPAEELHDKYYNLFVNFLVNPVLSVEEKCQLLEINDKKLKEIYPQNPTERGMFYVDGLVACYNLYEYILGEELKVLVQQDKNELNEDVENGTIVSNSMTKYLTPIFAHAALIRGKQDEFSMESSVWENYDIPKFIEEA